MSAETGLPSTGAILSRKEILKEIDNGNINVIPLDRNAIGCASVDLTLSKQFRYFKAGLNVLDVRDDINYKDYSERIDLKDGEGFLLLPGCTCLGITEETIELAPQICGLLEGRSRFARMGLFVHITAGFMNPGIKNRQVLEIYNASNYPLRLWPGTKICQFIFMRVAGEPEAYHGKFEKNDL